MNNFANYILNEQDYYKKLEIAYYFQKKTGIFFDNSVILKTELARMFMENIDLGLDKNIVLTACLVCGCKKKKDATDKDTIKNYAQDGAKYLATIGFDKRFCKICEEVNRYSGSTPREPESDILEVVDIFGGLVLDRPERRGYPIDEAVVLTEYRNLKGYKNRFLEQFKEFIFREEEGKNMNEFELKTNYDFEGPLSDLIQLARACEKAGLDVRNMINILKRPDKKAVLKEINEYAYKKTEAQRELESKLAQEERAKDFGFEKRASLS